MMSTLAYEVYIGFSFFPDAGDQQVNGYEN
jgi:hypothetical protein